MAQSWNTDQIVIQKSQTVLETAFHPSLELLRYPARRTELLQAWDSADELMLAHLSSLESSEISGKRVLIIQELFGALSCALSSIKDLEITSYTDSFVSENGARLNAQRNGVTLPLHRIHSLSELSGIYDLVLIKLPHNLSFFEDILCRLTHHLGRHSKIICGAMIKHLPRTSFELLEKHIGKTSTSLAAKKARLIFACFEKTAVSSPYPIEVAMESPFEVPFIHQSNLFSREKLDIGTRFFLQHIPQADFKAILDLGCANGVVGIQAQLLNPGAELHFSDDSFMAIESARVNFERQIGTQKQAHFHWTNCFENQEKDSLDLILCNPPFHQQTTVGDFIAAQMFSDAHRSLKRGGLLRVIGNSHLRYEIKLQKLFGNSRIIATNRKFTIIDVIK